MPIRPLLACMTFAFALTLASPGAAQTGEPDFVFNVPVRIENAPPINGEWSIVECTVLDEAGRNLQSDNARVRVTDGAFRGTVRVEMRMREPVLRPASAARRYQCALIVASVARADGSRVSLGTLTSENVAGRYTTASGQSLVSHRLIVSGALR
jgi:hypothetical protein